VPKPRVLVAEDYEDVRLLYEECLARAGFEVMSAANGADAIEQARSAPPHAVLMDLQMPDVDGWEAIRRIRALALDPRPYILAVTAHIAEGSRVDAYEAGADDFVAKPISPDTICEIIRAALNNSQS
jgi:CheY-like chemotaxis protein